MPVNMTCELIPISVRLAQCFSSSSIRAIYLHCPPALGGSEKYADDKTTFAHLQAREISTKMACSRFSGTHARSRWALDPTSTCPVGNTSRVKPPLLGMPALLRGFSNDNPFIALLRFSLLRAVRFNACPWLLARFLCPAIIFLPWRQRDVTHHRGPTSSRSILPALDQSGRQRGSRRG